MTNQTFFVVQGETGRYLNYAYQTPAGEFYAAWGTLKEATYFETEEQAIERALVEEDYRQIQTFIVKVELSMLSTQTTKELAKQLEEKKQQDIQQRLMKKVPITRNELEQAVTILMQGSGRIIGSRVIKGEEMNLLFEEIETNRWVVKQKNIPL